MSDDDSFGESRQDQDRNDFDFEERKNPNQVGEQNMEKVDNQHFDEAVELSDEGEIQSNDGESGMQPSPPKNQMKNASKMQQSNDFSENGSKFKIQGAYNPADYENLDVANEVKELFKYIGRYKPQNIDLDTKMKAFIPDYIPAVGEVDAFIKMPRPDDKEESLGLVLLDEPSLNQSRKEKLDLIYNEFMKKKNKDKQQTVHKIENADKNPKQVTNWINDVGEIHKKKQPPSVSYSKQMPDIDSLMQEWPREMEEALNQVKLPTEELDLSLADFSKFCCNMMDIPIYPNNQQRNVIESLHVFFTLYSEFKANQHFAQNKDTDVYQPNSSQY